MIVSIGLLASVLFVTTAVVRSRPTISGEIALAGLNERVEIFRDVHGIPTIVASHTEDLWFAQGYVHAQDRFWEMDFRRHLTAGRLSELFGSSQIDTDTFIRTLGWRRTAEAELAAFDDETMTMLTSYAAGVNAWMDDRARTQLSLEHSLLPLAGPLRYQPEPWAPADSVRWIKAMAWDLSSVENDLERARLSVIDLGPGRSWQDLYPSPPSSHEPILPDGGQVGTDGWQPAGGDRIRPVRGVNHTNVGSLGSVLTSTPSFELDRPTLQAALTAAHQAVTNLPTMIGTGEHVGSNSWVIAPERSATGGALLANDLHLEPSQPSLWHQIGLQCAPITDRCPYFVTGFSFSGMPGVVMGRTDHAAWGVTNLSASVADLIVERLDDDRYLAPGDRWLPIETRTEVITVAGGPDVEIEIRTTANGPIISGTLIEAGHLAAGPLGDQRRDTVGYDHAIVLRWTALDQTRAFTAIPQLARLRSWDDFVAATDAFQIPNQSFVYADADGNIGYRAPGMVPIRRSGDGWLPVDGWTGEFGWRGYLDAATLPWLLNPQRGMIVAANQDTLPADAEPDLTRQANLGYRSQRIIELIGDRNDLTLDDLAAIQLDVHNANAQVLLPILLAVDDQGVRRVAQMQQLLAEWDGHDDQHSAGAAAFNATWRHLLALAFHDELPSWAHPSGGGRWWRVVHNLLDRPTSPWWDDLTTLNTETRDDILLTAMSDAHDELTDRLGSDPAGWRWGDLHTLELRHSTFGSSGIAPIERLFNRGTLATGGGSDVVNAIGWDAAAGYQVSRIPSMRMLVDLGTPDDGRWVHLTGQSGRPFSRHYTDQAERWRVGGYLPMTTSADAARHTAHDRLMLIPAD